MHFAVHFGFHSIPFYGSARLGRHGKVFLTVPSQDTTAEQKFIQKGETDGTDSLFDLDPKDTVFVVGGVPADVKVLSSCILCIPSFPGMFL